MIGPHLAGWGRGPGPVGWGGAALLELQQHRVSRHGTRDSALGTQGTQAAGGVGVGRGRGGTDRPAGGLGDGPGQVWRKRTEGR